MNVFNKNSFVLLSIFEKAYHYYAKLLTLKIKSASKPFFRPGDYWNEMNSYLVAWCQAETEIV